MGIRPVKPGRAVFGPGANPYPCQNTAPRAGRSHTSETAHGPEPLRQLPLWQRQEVQVLLPAVLPPDRTRPRTAADGPARGGGQDDEGGDRRPPGVSAG